MSTGRQPSLEPGDKVYVEAEVVSVAELHDGRDPFGRCAYVTPTDRLSAHDGFWLLGSDVQSAREAKARVWNEACQALAWALGNGPLDDALDYVVSSNPYGA